MQTAGPMRRDNSAFQGRFETTTLYRTLTYLELGDIAFFLTSSVHCLWIALGLLPVSGVLIT